MANIVFTDTGKSVKIELNAKKSKYGITGFELPKNSTPLITDEQNVNLGFYVDGIKIDIDFNDVDTPAGAVDASDLRGKLSDFFFKESAIFDPDAQIAFDAVVANGGALSNLEKGGYTIYRLDEKENNNAWEGDAHLDYPMIGGTVESMVINFQNPGTFDAIAVNTVSGDFTANGWTPNGVDSYFNSNLRPDPDSILNSIALEFYSRTDTGGGNIEWGSVTVDPTQVLRMRVRAAVNGILYDCYNTTGGRLLGTTPANSLGGHLFNRLSNVRSDVYVNGVSVIFITTSGGTRPTHKLYLGARNTVGVADGFDIKQCAGAGIYNGLTSGQSLAQYTARQLLNQTLSRQV